MPSNRCVSAPRKLADRVVYGRRDTPYEALSRLTERISDAPGDVLAGVAATVSRGVGAREVIAWVGDGEELEVRAVWPGDVDRVEQGLRVMVTGDGRGGATPGAGAGIQGLADRVAALGGRLVVDSPAGAGTRIEVVVPCA